MAYLHVAVAEAAAKEWDSDPVRAAIIPTCTEGIRTGRFPMGYLDAIGQLHRGGPSRWPRPQVAAFALIHRALMSGDAAETVIEVGLTPFRDAERQANATALEDLLPEPFNAHIDRTQSNAPQDGWLEWAAPITVRRSCRVPYYPSASDTPAPLTAPRIIPPGRVPLEVGSTMPSRTHLHLCEDQGVARWPYEATEIRLFISSKYPRPMFPGLLDI